MKFRILTILTVLYLSGCSLFVSQNSFGENWKGDTVDNLIAHWGEPAEINNKNNGEVEVIYKIFHDSCTYTFYADANGTITSYKYKSTTWGTCKPIG